MNRRRQVVAVMASGLALLPCAILAQSSRRMPRVGFVLTTAPLATMQGTEPSETVMRAFLKGLHELGYREGRDIVIERRSAEGKPERLQSLLRALVDASVDVIVVTGDATVKDAMRVTSTIPVVAAGMSGSAALQFAKSLAAPDGNLTGVIPSVTGSKRLQILAEITPKARRIAVLMQRSDWDQSQQELGAAASELGVTVYLAEVRMPNLESALNGLANKRPDALYVSAAPPFFVARKRIAEFARKISVPDMHYFYQAVEAGGLVSYGHDSFEVFRRSARYVDRILKGSKPRELPIEQLERYSLVVNLKSARALGLAVPPSILLRADRVIE